MKRFEEFPEILTIWEHFSTSHFWLRASACNQGAKLILGITLFFLTFECVALQRTLCWLSVKFGPVSATNLFWFTLHKQKHDCTSVRFFESDTSASATDPGGRRLTQASSMKLSTASCHTAAHVALGGSITHSEGSTIYPLPRAHRYTGLARVSVTDRWASLCYPSLSDSTDNFALLDPWLSSVDTRNLWSLDNRASVLTAAPHGTEIPWVLMFCQVNEPPLTQVGFFLHCSNGTVFMSQQELLQTRHLGSEQGHFILSHTQEYTGTKFKLFAIVILSQGPVCVCVCYRKCDVGSGELLCTLFQGVDPHFPFLSAAICSRSVPLQKTPPALIRLDLCPTTPTPTSWSGRRHLEREIIFIYYY